MVRLWWRIIVIGGTLFACYRLRSIITTLVVSAIIAYVLDPAVEWTCHRPGFARFHSNLFTFYGRVRARLNPRFKAPGPLVKHHTIRLCAASYVFVLAILGVWKGGGLIVSPFVQEIKHITSPRGRERLKEQKQEFLRKYDKSVPEFMQSDKIQEQLQNADFSEQIQKMAAEVGKSVVEYAKGIVEIVLIPVLAFYVLIVGRRLKHEFVGLLTKQNRRDTVRILNEFNRIMRAYISGQFILCLLAGVIVGLWLWGLGTKYPVILAVFAGLTRAIPVVGPIFGAIPILIIVVLTGQGYAIAIAFVIFFSLLHLVETKFIMPLLIGERIELHPVIIIVVLLIGGEIGALLIGNSLGGLLGMFFAAPLAALIRVIIRRYWLHLPSKPPKSPPGNPEIAVNSVNAVDAAGTVNAVRNSPNLPHQPN